MIWLFKCNECFRQNKIKVNEHYLFDVDDINFDLTKYDISFYFETASYYLLDDKNPNKMYELDYSGINRNPNRYTLSFLRSDFSEIKDFYNKEKRDMKLVEIGID